MQLISLQPSKSQKVTVMLNGQSCQLKLHQRSDGFYIDLYINGEAKMQGVLCENCNFLVRYSYLGFSGDLVFVDTQGTSDPEWSGIGTRYRLYYLTADEIA